MDKGRIAELIARFAWKDTIQEGGWQGFGWRQSVFAGVDHFHIQATPQPDFLTYGEHGLLVMAVTANTCLVTREYCDGRRADFAVATSIRGVADLLVAETNHKVGVAADAVLEKLSQRHMLTTMQVIGHV
ncbi:hypothetical protein MasN3_07260 [Massilia varians]|uniref:Uncharacterized protein n=1 Tax=Massilia varians TaxID=457921 RepID=A0ABM8C222_9BURK|nr:hypothetical protein [Massilia varians]BDT57232.1 hypothetical protein MasN3_07260 [Massilia varians]